MGQILHGTATTTHAIREKIQDSQESLGGCPGIITQTMPFQRASEKFKTFPTPSFNFA